MTHERRLEEPISAYRMGDPKGEYIKLWEVGGSRLTSGRWHGAGASVIYASVNYSTAMLEKRVHYSGELPPNQHFIDITIPAGLTYEVVNPDLIDGWSRPDGEPARQFGRAWFVENRSAILLVPSVVARMEKNILTRQARGGADRYCACEFRHCQTSTRQKY